MHLTNIITVVVVVYCLCLTGDCELVPSHLIDNKHQDSQFKKSTSKLDCSQFENDYDIFRQFPFPVLINTDEPVFNQSTVTMDDKHQFVKDIYIRKEKVVPSSVFCLFNLETLHIELTPFQDDIVPDALGNLKQIRDLWIYNSSIVQMTDQLATLTNMHMLILSNCSLTRIQNLSNLQKMWSLDLSHNHLSHIEGIPGVEMLDLDDNHFKEIPMTDDPDKLEFIDMRDNPLTNAVPIMSYKNLEGIYLSNTSLTSIPPTIDKLRHLKYLRLSDNKLSYVPRNILNLRGLKEFTIHNNSLSANDIQAIRKAFKKSHPKLHVSI